jgi:acid stress chaperone HdeA
VTLLDIAEPSSTSYTTERSGDRGSIAREEHPMKIRPAAIGVAAAILMTSSAPVLAEAGAPRKPLRAMTCHDFLLIDDAAKPEIVYWVATYGKYGKPESMVIDVDDTDKIVPVLVEACKQAPNESFWQKARGEAAKLEKMETRRDG